MITLACATLLVGLATGCGGSDESARDTAQAYVDARNSGDAAKICDLLSDQLKQAFQTTSCESFIKEATTGAATDFKLGGVQENGDQAVALVQATVTSEGKTRTQAVQVTLDRQDGDWKISGVGGLNR